MNELGKKYVFHLKKKIEPTRNFLGIFNLTKGPANTLTPLSQNVISMQISTQTDNHKYRKNVETKKVLFKKMGLKFRNPNFNILCKIAFVLLYKMPILWSSGTVQKQYIT